MNYDNTLHVAILLAYFTGLRMGEILGLKNKYLDLDNKILEELGKDIKKYQL